MWWEFISLRIMRIYLFKNATAVRQFFFMFLKIFERVGRLHVNNTQKLASFITQHINTFFIYFAYKYVSFAIFLFTTSLASLVTLLDFIHQKIMFSIWNSHSLMICMLAILHRSSKWGFYVFLRWSWNETITFKSYFEDHSMLEWC